MTPADETLPTRKPPIESTAGTSSYACVLGTLRIKAKELGYALALHGSMVRDLDLVAVPWVEDAAAPEVLVEAMRVILDGSIIPTGTKGARWDGEKFVDAVIENPSRKPHGRLAWNIHLGGEPKIDLSVMPLASPSETPNSSPATDPTAPDYLANWSPDEEPTKPASIGPTCGKAGCQSPVTRVVHRDGDMIYSCEGHLAEISTFIVVTPPAPPQDAAELPDNERFLKWLQPENHEEELCPGEIAAKAEEIYGPELARLRSENERLATELANERASGGQSLAEARRERDEVGDLISDCRNIWHALVCADSELSAIGHGRSPSSKDELLRISHKLRAFYETHQWLKAADSVRQVAARGGG